MDALLTSAFVLRLLGLSASGDQAAAGRLKSFQVLSFVAPFIWYVYLSLVFACHSQTLDREFRMSELLLSQCIEQS